MKDEFEKKFHLFWHEISIEKLGQTNKNFATEKFENFEI
jgi:hypothetical protein